MVNSKIRKKWHASDVYWKNSAETNEKIYLNASNDLEKKYDETALEYTKLLGDKNTLWRKYELSVADNIADKQIIEKLSAALTTFENELAGYKNKPFNFEPEVCSAKPKSKKPKSKRKKAK